MRVPPILVPLMLLPLACTPRASGGTPADVSDASASAPDAATVSGPSDAGGADAHRADAGGHDDAGRRDAGLQDGGLPDAGVGDAGGSDAGGSDAGGSDAGGSDAGGSDAGGSDAGGSDAGGADAGGADAAVADAAVPDAAVADAGHAGDAGQLPTAQCAQLVVTGQATGTNGATWRYVSTDDGVDYDLSGILLQPTTGTAPYPAVVVSHGRGGSANGYSRNAGQHFRNAGAVVIATNYTHAQVPSGLPLGGNGGTSAQNMLRASKTLALLACLPQVDLSRVAAHGHSQGAFITAQLVGTWPQVFTVASHSAGGVSDTGTVNDNVPTTTEAAARAIRAPYQLHHGDMDEVVDLSLGQAMDAILTQSGVPHELHVYPGASHADVSLDPTVFTRVMAWYALHGFF